MLTKTEFLQEMQNRMNAYIGYEKFTTLAQVEAAMMDTLSWGDSLPPKNGADSVTLFRCDEKDQKILGCETITEYERVKERDEDGEPITWEAFGYEID